MAGDMPRGVCPVEMRGDDDRHRPRSPAVRRHWPVSRLPRRELQGERLDREHGAEPDTARARSIMTSAARHGARAGRRTSPTYHDAHRDPEQVQPRVLIASAVARRWRPPIRAG